MEEDDNTDWLVGEGQKVVTLSSCSWGGGKPMWRGRESGEVEPAIAPASGFAWAEAWRAVGSRQGFHFFGVGAVAVYLYSDGKDPLEGAWVM